jgi:RHS repeat-associated protein
MAKRATHLCQAMTATPSVPDSDPGEARRRMRRQIRLLRPRESGFKAVSPRSGTRPLKPLKTSSLLTLIGLRQIGVIPKRAGVTFYTYRWYDPVHGRWPSRDPIAEEAFFKSHANSEGKGIIAKHFMNLYAFVNNSPTSDVDLFGLCGKNTCDKWKITTKGGGGGGEIVAGVIIIAQLEADSSCCMDKHSRGYNWNGIGLAVGFPIGFSIDILNQGNEFETPCIGWDAHVGSGNYSSVSGGIFVTINFYRLSTPQTVMSGIGYGVGADLFAGQIWGRWHLLGEW